MSHRVELIEHGELVEVRLDAPPVNALSVACTKDWFDGFTEALARSPKAIALRGRSNAFSAGANVKELAEAAIAGDWDRVDRSDAGMYEFFCAVGNSHIPVYALIDGHCMGAASVLALMCDERYMCAGKGRFQFNHPLMGVTPQPFVVTALRDLVGNREATQLLLKGEALSAQEALSIGLVDRVVEPDQAIAVVLQEIERRNELPQAAWLKSRTYLRASIRSALSSAASSSWRISSHLQDPALGPPMLERLRARL